MTTATEQSIELANELSGRSYHAEESHIPTMLLRNPCHLEVLIPALNEAKRLPHTLMRTIEYLERQPYSSSVVVIDNGSVDQTSDIAAMATWSERVPVFLTGCARLGKGAAVRRGILTSRAHFIGYMDADLATPIETLDVVMTLLGDGEARAVVGSRRISGANLARRQPVHRAVGGMVFHALTQRVLGDLTDTQCGFKFFTGDLARTVARQLTIDGFAFDVEMLRAISELGVDIKEIPVTWTDANGSTLNSLRDGTRAAVDLYRLSRRRTA
jgi:dolichyl-phosphate beta-glucosyltransferase